MGAGIGTGSIGAMGAMAGGGTREGAGIGAGIAAAGAGIAAAAIPAAMWMAA